MSRDSRTHHARGYAAGDRYDRATRDRKRAGGIRRRPILETTTSTRKGTR